ncbi:MULTISPECIES: NADH-quinone oxidoreductase subunit C [unclassified Sphingopyxis]|uniref:NADH-quinone oxidoreductase subunit C n=1 Tax=unclassified Sphingopyxis TaxID=2614943 RepID=UPI000735EEB7|nr:MULTISPECIES: NADH-quinone oxidoreductase subunit C [unclassified Sphingopyxis]KTE31829.1 NADH dehydrogenase [Sphingopyxis sp. HIX]KTE83220.1 NADH dehydrogenase [Sphingopyxis sp. HXXIV]
MGHPAPLVAPQSGLAAALNKLLGKDLLAHDFAADEDSITVDRDAIAAVMIALRDNLEYQQMMEIAGVDYPERAERFEVVYHLLSVTRNHRLRVRVTTDEATPVPTIVPVWPNAGWLEREVFDMYGVLFAGNPDLRRILTDYGFQGHPQRKDFPLTGYTELRYSEEDKRVVYEPVKLAQDFRNFDFLSPWEGADYVLPGDEKAGGTGEAPGKGAPTPLTAKEVKAADDKAKAPPPPTPKTTEKPEQTGAGAKANIKAAKTSRDGAKAKPATKPAKTPATEKAPAKPRAPRKPKGGDA